MKFLSGVGLGLSLNFGCLLLGFVAELYYLLWWKKRINSREIQHDYSSPARKFLYRFCWRKPPSFGSLSLKLQELCSSVRVEDTHVHQPQAGHHPNKDLRINPIGENGEQTELMRLQAQSSLPRFLFTIVEETKEDMESEDGKSRGEKSRKGSRNRSLSDMLLTAETPFFTPLSSPPYFTPPLTPLESLNCRKGFDSVSESSSDAEFNGVRSPPRPKFKFLRDAEEKHHGQNLGEEAEKGLHSSAVSLPNDGIEVPSTSVFLTDDENGYFITLVVS